MEDSPVRTEPRRLFPLVPLAGLLVMVGGLLGANLLAQHLRWSLVPATVLSEGALALLAFAMAAVDGRGFERFGFGGGWRGIDFGAVPIFVSLHYLVSIVIGLLLVSRMTQQSSSAAHVLSRLAQQPIGQALAGAALLALLAGVCEEIAFRGYLIPRLEAAGAPVWLAVALSALAFGAVHIPGYGWIAALPKTISFGVPVGAYFIWRRSIWPGIVTHVLVDFSAFSLLIVAAHISKHLQP